MQKRPYQTQSQTQPSFRLQIAQAAMLWEPLKQQRLLSLGEGEMRQTWFEYHQERQAATRKKQQDNLTAEQSERYAQEVRGAMQDLVQVRRRERQKEAENRGFFEVTDEEAILDQAIKWPPGSDKHPFQRIADLSLKIAGRNPSLRYHLFKLLGEEAEKGTCAAAIYEAVWETISLLAHDVLDESIGVVYDEPIQESAREPVHNRADKQKQINEPVAEGKAKSKTKSKAASAA